MTIRLEILALPDDRDISFPAAKLFHAQCSNKSSLSMRKGVSDSIYVLKCPCGLQLSFQEHGEAQRLITRVAIGGESAEISQNAFTSPFSGSIAISLKA